jgi:hypothetical protein
MNLILALQARNQTSDNVTPKTMTACTCNSAINAGVQPFCVMQVNLGPAMEVLSTETRMYSTPRLLLLHLRYLILFHLPSEIGSTQRWNSPCPRSDPHILITGNYNRLLRGRQFSRMLFNLIFHRLNDKSVNMSRPILGIF